MRQKLSKTVVDGIKPGGADVLVWDVLLPRFGVKVTPAGVKVFIVQYRGPGGRRGQLRRVTLGRYGHPFTVEQARQRAREVLGDVAHGKDPAALKVGARTAPTVSDLVERFMREHVQTKTKPSTATEYDRLLKVHVLPSLATRQVAEVTYDDVAKLHHRLQGSRYAANRMVAVLGKMFALSERWGYRPRGMNPARGIEKYKEQRRERSLSLEELQRLGQALAHAKREACPTHGADLDKHCLVCLVAGRISPFIVAAIEVLALTGARKSEITTLRKSAMDLEAGCLRLEDSKTGKKTIRLPQAAIEVLRALPTIEGTDYVFPGRSGTAPITLKGGWEDIRTVAGLTGVRIHDLRHSFASTGVNDGLSHPTIGALLGHSQPATTARYTHFHDDPLHRAADQIGGAIAAAMNGTK